MTDRYALASRYRWAGVTRVAIIGALLALAGSAAPVRAAAQGTPAATQSVVCSDLTATSATPVTSPTIPQSTASINRANLMLSTETVLACRDARDWPTLAALMAPAYLSEHFSTEAAAEAAAQLAILDEAGVLASIELVAAGEPVASGSTGQAAVTYLEGGALRREEWRFQQIGGRWLLSEVTPLPPLLTTNAVGIPVVLDASGIASTRESLVNPGTVVLSLSNDTGLDAGFALFHSPPATTPERFLSTLAAGQADPVSLVAWVVVSAGEPFELVLPDLPPGAYFLVGGYDPRFPDRAPGPDDVLLFTVME
jgi:hypothetical protein